MKFRHWPLSLLILASVSPVALFAAADPEPPIFKAIPGFEITGKNLFKGYNEQKVSYKLDDNRIEEVVGGEYWYREYEKLGEDGKRDRTFSKVEIMRNYESEVERLGGFVYRRSGNRRTFIITRPDESRVVCLLYVADGYYTSTIISEEGMEQTLSLSADEMLRRIEEEGSVTVYGINFNSDEWMIIPGSGKVLDEVAQMMLNAPKRYEIQGHTDERGENDYNMELGRRRAEAIRNILMAYGIDGDRLETKSYGEEKPLDPGHDEKAWAANRRAVFLAID